MTTKNIKYWLEEKSLKTPEHDKLLLWSTKNIEKILKGTGIWEKERMSKLNNIKNTIEFNLSQIRSISRNQYYKNQVIGFIDLKSDIRYNDGHDIVIYFEIKPKINSIGEVMRQVNFYRNYINTGSYNQPPFIIVTKTKGLKDIFKSQDVYVYEYQDEEENQQKLEVNDNGKMS